MNWLLVALVSLSSGLLGSLGLGAGTVLLLYLRIYGGYDQFAAQGINLLFFLPIGLCSLWLHSRNRLVRWKQVGCCLLSGVPGVFLGFWIGGQLGTELLSKLFGLLLCYIGLRALFTRAADGEKRNQKKKEGLV